MTEPVDHPSVSEIVAATRAILSYKQEGGQGATYADGWLALLAIEMLLVDADPARLIQAARRIERAYDAASEEWRREEERWRQEVADAELRRQRAYVAVDYHPCPTCLAAPGHACQTNTGNPLPRSQPHKSRVNLPTLTVIEPS